MIFTTTEKHSILLRKQEEQTKVRTFRFIMMKENIVDMLTILAINPD